MANIVAMVDEKYEAMQAEMQRMTAENERLMRCISGIEDELCREPPRVGDALFICEAAKATETKMRPDQQQPPSCDKAPNKHHYLMPSGQCSCQDQSWAK